MRRILQEDRPYDIPVDAAYGVLFAVMGATFLLTVAGLFAKKGKWEDLLHPTDDFLSARNRYTWPTIALSFFASGMGAWVVYGTPEMGAIRITSWWGVIGYSSASAVSGWVFMWLGPIVKKQVGEATGFSAVDFALQRYGRLMQLLVMGVSTFAMFIYVVAELTTIANVYATFVGKSTVGSDSEVFTTKVASIMIIFTWAYTALAGLPASILTDKFQGALVAVFVVMLLFAATTLKSNEVSHKQFDNGTGWFSEGFEALVTLWIALISFQLFDQGAWQRVFAAKTDRDMRIGFGIGGAMIFVLMMFFGIMGMIAYSRDPDSYENFSKLGYLSIFDLIRNLPQFWHYVTLVLLTLLAASSIDTLQNGLASIFSHDLIKCKLSPNWSRLLIVGLNIGAVIMSSRRYEVVPLFLVADLVAATAVFPLFLGIRNEDWVFGGEDSRLPMLPKVTIPAPTELGAFLGAISAMIAVVINGEINNVHKAINPYTGKVYDRSALAYFWLIQNPTETCALCGKKTMVTFIVVPLVGLVFTLFWSFLDVLVGGDKARQPFCFIPRLDRDDEEDAMLGDVRLDEKN